jgi:ribose transport system permease protein
MRRTVKAVVKRNDCNRPAIALGDAVVGQLQTAVPNPLGRRHIATLEQNMQVAQRHAVGGRNPLKRKVGITKMRQIDGPEDVILDQDDHIYVGNRTGDIVRFFAPDYKRQEVYAHVGGRPLGMAFAKDGSLLVCIGGMGLYRLTRQRQIEKLTDETNRSWFSIIDDSRLRLADDLDVAPDGRVFFSEATIRYEMHEWPVDCLESRGNGRIISFDPNTGKTQTVLKNLVFPNGICVTHEGQSFLFAETWACRISRYSRTHRGGCGWMLAGPVCTT